MKKYLHSYIKREKVNYLRLVPYHRQHCSVEPVVLSPVVLPPLKFAEYTAVQQVIPTEVHLTSVAIDFFLATAV